MPMMPTPDNNYARRTNHDYIGSFGRIPNEPIKKEEETEPNNVASIINNIKDKSVTIQKVQKDSKDEKVKMEFIVISDETEICKLITEKEDKPHSVKKLLNKLKDKIQEAVELQRRWKWLV